MYKIGCAEIFREDDFRQNFRENTNFCKHEFNKISSKYIFVSTLSHTLTELISSLKNNILRIYIQKDLTNEW